MPPICIAVLSWLLSFEEREPCSTPPICTAVRLPFVGQYAPHLYGSTFGEILGVGVTGTFLSELPHPQLSENSRRLWLFPGSVRGFSRKTPGKSRENCWKNFPESRNATCSSISGTGKGKPAGNLGPTLPDLVPTFRAGCFLKSTVPAISSTCVRARGRGLISAQLEGSPTASLKLCVRRPASPRAAATSSGTAGKCRTKLCALAALLDAK